MESNECLLELRSQLVESLAVPLTLRDLFGNVFARLIDAGLEQLELLGVRGRQLLDVFVVRCLFQLEPLEALVLIIYLLLVVLNYASCIISPLLEVFVLLNKLTDSLSLLLY